MLNEMGTIDLTPIIKAVLLLISVVITCVVVPWIRAHTSAEKQENLRALYRTLVFAAEQLYGAGNGPEKLNYVCARLREMGYEVNLSEVEAAVYEWLNFDTPLLRATAGERIATSAPEEETGERIATSVPEEETGERIATSVPEEETGERIATSAAPPPFCYHYDSRFSSQCTATGEEETEEPEERIATSAAPPRNDNEGEDAPEEPESEAE